MNVAIAVLALLTGLVTGAVFRFFHVPIPAPPNLAGVLGIIGIFLGYRALAYLDEYFDIGIDLLAVLGLR